MHLNGWFREEKKEKSFVIYFFRISERNFQICTYEIQFPNI